MKSSSGRGKGTIRGRAGASLAKERVDQQRRLLHVGQLITSEMNLNSLFPLIMEQSNRIMNTERSSVFLYDSKTHELWSLVATDLKRDEVRTLTSYGIGGWVFENRKPAIVNDCYSDERFNAEVDKRTGFRTRNLLCVPLINRRRECIGTLQVLNKKNGKFNDEDLELLTSMSHYVTIALENSMLYEELKSMNKAKERVIDHLSHEMKTPLALISATANRISRNLQHQPPVEEIEMSLIILQRNVERLMRLQKVTTDIMKQRSAEEKTHIIKLVQDALNLLEYETQMPEEQKRLVLERIRRHLELIYGTGEGRKERIAIPAFLDALCRRALQTMGQRDVRIGRNVERGLAVFMHKDVLEKVCSGILRNAVENTPDGGRIEVSAQRDKKKVLVQFRDYGVGITAENQKLIFTGFFHTLDTNYYTSKEPYQFNAGGTGADLLRAKVFSQRFGFGIDFESTRCPYVPGDTEVCPGNISACRFVKDREECAAKGGTTFSLTIPMMTPHATAGRQKESTP